MYIHVLNFYVRQIINFSEDYLLYLSKKIYSYIFVDTTYYYTDFQPSVTIHGMNVPTCIHGTYDTSLLFKTHQVYSAPMYGHRERS